ncbi:fungal fucose-specific lectin-domain-containing protein [Trametes gibbosa]|nr:fungal fucose-specific lectin-domain-containing protein [Trametes gibbosa]
MPPNPDRDQSIPPPDVLVQVAETDIVFGRTVVPVPLHKKPLKKGRLGHEYAEHTFIGDTVDLTFQGGRKVVAFDHTFTLINGLSVTYGQINGLAGDFYGTTRPISDGTDARDQEERFLAAYNTLADVSPRLPQEARDILGVLQAEVNAVNDARNRGEDPSVAYSKLPDASVELQRLTILRPDDFPSYLGLALINWDHFGADARTAYNAGHGLALRVAADGDLEKAYTLNAFADHFLEDSFSAGHLRTPRRSLHGSTANFFPDLCAKFMHDEDCAIGLSVRNRRGESWTCFGDKRALDQADTTNLQLCVAAVQASVDEIYQAFKTRVVSPPSTYAAWTIAPTLESALGEQELAPLFKFGDDTRKTLDRRAVIKNRRLHSLTSDWWYWKTALDCKTSGWWDYPITISGPPKIAPWSSIAATTPRTWSARFYYQDPRGGVLESTHLEGQWTDGANRPPLWDAAPYTPLAAISWGEGAHIRVYYLDTEYKLQEACYDDGTWRQQNLNFQAARDSAIAACKYERGGGLHIRVYYQEEGSHAIREVCYDRGAGGAGWSAGFGSFALSSALSGTSLVAVAYEEPGDVLNLRVYYQAADLSVREHAYRNERWFAGEFDGGKAPGHTPIGVLHGSRGGVPSALDVYWTNTERTIVHSVNKRGCWERAETVVGPVAPGVKFAAAQWAGGKHVRVYYQAADGSVREVCCDDGGEWYPGHTLGANA